MKQRSLSALIGFVYIICISACGHTDDKFLSEGEIEYDATVVDQSNPMATLAPSKMTIKFKENRSCAEMSAGMGLFSTSFISDPETQTLTQLVKLLNKKFSLIQDAAAIKKENEAYPVEVTACKETKLVAGYKCNKSHVVLKDEFGSVTEFDIYYTRDLDIKNPNFANPFHMIDGVLMEYQIKRFGLEMRFTAKNVKPVEVDDECFQLPADYKAISQKEMNELFEGLQ